jgi:outer membrane immunogenic protein
VGLNAGYAWSEGDVFNNCINGAGVFFAGGCTSPLFVPGRDASGWLAGGQIGYNYQFRGWWGNNWVFGWEADLQAADINRSAAFFDPAHVLTNGVAPFGPLTYAGKSEIDWFGTVRGRLGFAWDRVFLYGTGGVIFANVNSSHFLSITSNATGNVFSAVGAHDSITPGWIVGGGLEYAFTNNLSLKVEGMYYELQRTHAGAREFVNGNFATPSGFVTSSDFENHGFLVRGGINWRFWGM